MTVRRAGSVLALLLVTAPATATAAAPRPSDLQARSATVVDAATGEPLLERRARERRPIASATKLMTALVVLERAEPGRVLRAADYRPLPVESQIGLRPGERMRVSDLLTALLLESANDAAVTLAEGVSGSRAAFVRTMNARARALGLRDTRFANPIGLDDPRNHSSAADLAALARRLMAEPRFRRIVDRPRAVLRSGARRRTVENRNRLVRSEPFVDGVKTGHTQGAGYVLVGSATRRDVRVIAVVLGEPSEAARDAEALSLLRYGLGRFRRATVVREGANLARRGVRDRDGERVALVAGRGLVRTVRRGAPLRTRVSAPTELEGPLPAGARVGTAVVRHRGRELGRVPVVVATAVPGPTPTARLLAVLGRTATTLLGAAAMLLATLVALRIRVLRARRAGRGGSAS